MSLFDYMNSTTTGLGSSTSANGSLVNLLGTGNAGSSSADAVLDAIMNGKVPTSTKDVTISSSAEVAAATKKDADTDAAKLSAELRKTLDAQYKAGNRDPNLSKASPRALSTILLNKSGEFTASEVHAAKREMRERDRSALLQVTASSGFTLSALQSYQTQMQVAKASMSVEEKAVRDSGLI